MIKTYMKPRKIKPRAVKVREYKVKPIVVRREAVDKDFLKYIKVVRAWARYKHGLSLEDFEMLCYLYSEHVFDANQFDQYCQIFGFTKNRRLDLMEKGLIVHFRKPEPGKRAIYELSHQAKAIMRQVYAKDPFQSYLTSSLKAINPITLPQGNMTGSLVDLIRIFKAPPPHLSQ
jgi:hypothetical protein